MSITRIRDSWLYSVFIVIAIAPEWAFCADAQVNQTVPEAGVFRSLDGLILIDKAYIDSNAEGGYRKAAVNIVNIGKEDDFLIDIDCGGNKTARLHKKNPQGKEAVMLSDLQPERISGQRRLDLNPEMLYGQPGFSNPGYIAIPDSTGNKETSCIFDFRRAGAVEVHFNLIDGFYKLNRF